MADDQKTFWGKLAALTAFITAVVGLLAALQNAVFRLKAHTSRHSLHPLPSHPLIKDRRSLSVLPLSRTADYFAVFLPTWGVKIGTCSMARGS